ncbi:ThuA domain-containing protein [Roseiconus lacunae]|uniref:ThuA domain-containing protein n=1 Tax=Roseiconus lacunae TaxID=2605694 RepID=UPI003088E45C|nr:ThuA domain-containing protein [Stieleria sp. HD01]
MITIKLRVFFIASVVLLGITGSRKTWAQPSTTSIKSVLNVQLRSQRLQDSQPIYRPVIDSQSWQANKTAVIVCDMWDSHHCYRAVKRATELAPRMNAFLDTVREQGVTIIHAPSGCMSAYQDHPARKRAAEISKAVPLPAGINQWCYSIDREADEDYPIDQSDGGEDDTPEEHEAWRQQLIRQGRNPRSPWKKQMDALTIDASCDFISDRGDEIWSLLKQRSIDNVMLVGVHTNMCVLGRPFGLRQLAKNHVNVALVRDLTDTMYNPAAKPFVNHFTGTDLVIDYIERTVCPTISSEQILGGSAFRFSSDTRPTIVMMIGESEYATAETLPRYALENLGKTFRVRYVLEHHDRDNHFVGLDGLDEADLLVVSVRRKPLPGEQLQRVRDYISAGKSVFGIRTASHAFCLRNSAPPEGLVDWPEFDREVFGGNYTNHHPNTLSSKVFPAAPLPQQSPLARGIEIRPFRQGGSLYKVRPLVSTATVLAIGRAEGVGDEPVAWAYTRVDGGQSFYTSLGHRQDFRTDEFIELLDQVIKTYSGVGNTH